MTFETEKFKMSNSEIPRITKLSSNEKTPLPEEEGFSSENRQTRKKEIESTLEALRFGTFDFSPAEDVFGREFIESKFFLEDDKTEIETGRIVPQCDYENIEKYFFALFKEMRGPQKESIAWLKEKLLDPEIKFIVLEAPTGSGKSGLALSCALASGDAFISTNNRYLQDQYEEDFSKFLSVMKGKANYKCRAFPPKETNFTWEKDYNCSNSPCRASKSRQCGEKGACEFFKVLNDARRSSVTLFNIAAALAYTNSKSLPNCLKEKREGAKKLNDSVSFPMRKLFVLDEAHATPDWITSYYSLELSLNDIVKFDLSFQEIPNYTGDGEIDHYMKFFENVEEELGQKLASLGESEINTRLSTFKAEFSEKLGAFGNSLETEGSSNLVVVKEFGVKESFGKVLSVAIKPIEVSQIAKAALFNKAEKFIFMSATMLDVDTFCQVLGIEKHLVAVKSLPSTFPKENRKIITGYNVGCLNARNLDSKLPEVVELVDKLLYAHEKDKGIIHGHTYKICNYIAENSHYKNSRIIYPKKASEQKDAIREHLASKSPTVLLSPSMAEGVNLKDDASRFQIVAKVPYAYLGDPVLQRRMEIYPGYYDMLTALTLVQQYGRSVRSETDFAVTYIIDEAFKFFIRKRVDIFSPWFVEAVQ